MSNVYSGGLGGSTGDELCTYSNLVISPTNNVWYVHFATGVDSGTPAGRERLQPLKTLAQAYTNAVAGDIIVFLSGHAQTLTAVQTIAKAGLRLVSEGNGVANMAKFTTNGAAVGIFNITAAAVLVANMYFPTGLVNTTAARIVVDAVAGVTIRGCHFDCSARETTYGAIGPSLGTTYCRIEDCTFVSTATAVSAVPAAAILTANPLSDCTVDGCTFDGGTVGWGSGYAINFGDAVTRLMAVNVDLLNGSDFTVASGSYVINIRNRTGSARLIVNS